MRQRERLPGNVGDMNALESVRVPVLLGQAGFLSSQIKPEVVSTAGELSRDMYMTCLWSPSMMLDYNLGLLLKRPPRHDKA